MSTKPIDWRNSNSYLEFLSAFQVPHDIQKVIDWSWPTHTLYIKTAQIIQQWLQEGILVSATPEESLGKLFQAAQLKSFLKENNLPVSGSKSEMIDRLLMFNRPKMNEFISQSQIVKCSDAAIKIITAFKEQVRHVIDLAEQTSLNALRNGDYREACKVFIAYKRQVSDPLYQMDPLIIEEIRIALTGVTTLKGGQDAHC